MKKGNQWIAFFVVLGSILLLSAVVLAILAAVLLKQDMSSQFISGSVIASYVISCLAGGFAMGQCTGRHNFLWGIGIGVCYFGVLLLAGKFLYPHGGKTDIQLISSFLICMVAGMLGGMLAPRVRK